MANKLFQVLYKGHRLKFEPMQTPEGKFLAEPMVSFSRGGSDYDARLVPPQGPFESAREAADCAAAAARSWVDHHGG